MLLWWCVGFLLVSAKKDEWLEVQTAQGPIWGRKNTIDKIYAFYNVPYATAPTGEDKFKAPLPPPTWTQPYKAVDTFTITCPQNEAVMSVLLDMYVMQENCLVANIFVPDTNNTNLSVFVYIHGGAFVFGYGNVNKATELMRTNDFIFVTFNYRLGIHGFLCLGTEDAPGNAGMKDQVALLRWVQENIASFGGNPDDVTIGGSSAGGISVDLLMLSKAAAGLFHRAIPESGGCLSPMAIQSDPLETAKAHAIKLNFTDVDNIYSLGHFYKTAPMKLLTSDLFFDRTDGTFVFSPCVERDTGYGSFLTEAPLNLLKKGSFEKLPMLYGYTSMEGLLRIDYYDLWMQKMNIRFEDFLPANINIKSETGRNRIAAIVKDFYFNKPLDSDDKMSILGYVNFFTDVLFAYPILWAVKLQVEAGNNQVYLYQYSFLEKQRQMLPNNKIGVSGHAAQSAAWLDVKDTDPSGITPEYQNMSMIMRKIWHNFIKTGMPVPRNSWLPVWPPASADRAPHMSLGEKLELRGILGSQVTRFWDSVYLRLYRDPKPPPDPSDIQPKIRIEI
ncbi:para-nitrobenzyl esterase [Helicoverpa armigera]|uniref:para-nitrobenzyl esterase n=1 Tax=Helicoverpa armigera TaxID=29058 RepID=UPI003082A11B